MFKGASITTEQSPYPIDSSPLCCELSKLLPIRIVRVCGGEEERLWDSLVRQYHYLGYRKMVGCHLKYLAFHGQRPIAALGWRAAALKLEVRDCFIGWSDEQRRRHIHRIANGNRFLILPWVQVRFLASYLLGRNIKAVVQDWQQVYGHRLLLVETFVDGRRFFATSYKAANWVHVGQTKGYTKRGKGYEYHGHPKEVYLYVVERRFRQILGCRQRPVPQCSARTQRWEGELQMVIRQPSWNPDVVPRMELGQAEKSEAELLAEELVRFHDRFIRFYRRREQHGWGLLYLRGLLSSLERKTMQSIALLLKGSKAVRMLQDFISAYVWDHEGMGREHRAALCELVGDEEGMVNVDSSEIGKKGTESVGVARQYCGSKGKIDNCQSGVFVGYASPKGYGLLDCQLYMPERWFTDEYAQRRCKCHVPTKLQFRTKIEIAREILKKLGQEGIRARWLGCDTVFGSSKEFLDEIGTSWWYFAQVSCDTEVWWDCAAGTDGSGAQKPSGAKRMTVAAIRKHPAVRWEAVKLAEGTKGPIVAEVALLRVAQLRKGGKGPESWLFIRKDSSGKVKYALSNAPESVSEAQLFQASTLRWPIEQCFQEGKEYLGMDHYTHRSWPGWHRHMLFVSLAQLFLLQLRLTFQKKNYTLTLPQARILVTAAVEENCRTRAKAIEIVQYHMRRNDETSRAHRRRTLKDLRKRWPRLRC